MSVSVLEALFPTLNEDKICKIFSELCQTLGTPDCIWSKQNLLVNTSFCSDFSQYATIFSQSWTSAIFFYFWYRPCGILMSVFKDCVMSFTWTAWVLFSSYLKEIRKTFSIWSFTEKVSFISFHREIWSSDLEINKSITRKDLHLQK